MRPGGDAANTPGWKVRVVPNLYPALAATASADPSEGPASQAGSFASTGDPLLASRRSGEPDLFVSRPALGAHEVIINAPEHLTAIADLSEQRFAEALAVWRERMRAHADAPYVQVIVNEGAGAGASLEHTHAQLYALSFVPAVVARERERYGAYRERSGGGGLLSDVLVEEIRRRERLVAIDEEAALICPWASRSPFELRVLPRREAASFGEDSTGAAMIHTALRALTKRFGRAARAEPLGPNCTPRNRVLPLACRHCASSDGQGRIRVEHRSRHQCLSTRASRRRPAGDHRRLDRPEPALWHCAHRGRASR